jgi:hypothetical protein
MAAGQSWQLLGPAEWGSACSVSVTAQALAADERLAVVLVNAGGQDNATANLLLTGTLPFAAADVAPVASVAVAPLPPLAPTALAYDRTPLEEGHALSSAQRQASTAAWLAAGAPRPIEPTGRVAAAAAAVAPRVGDSWSVQYGVAGPCVRNFSASPSTLSRQPATLQYIALDPGTAKPNALFYVTNEAWTRMTGVLSQRPDFFATLGSYFEGTPDATHNPAGARHIYPELHNSFGVETDVDGNGALVFLFADLGHTSSGSFTVGYFDSTDVTSPIDATASCTGSGSNHADMLYLLDPATFTGLNYPLSTVLDQETPGTMAHELQHNVIFNNRCWAHGVSASCDAIDNPAGDLWLNEGLSMISEDFAGFGLNGSSERSRLARYLNCTRTSSTLCYQDVSLTSWPPKGPGDATGHYGGSHAFVRWHADQADQGRYPALATMGRVPGATDGSAFTWAISHSAQLSRPALATASGLGFEEGYARFATAALFSGEDSMFTTYPLKPAPAFSFAPPPAPWAPLHTALVDGSGRYGRVAYTTLPRPGGASLLTTLHTDGWGAYVTGKGSGVDASLGISTTAAVQPHVVVIRFKGSLQLP